MSFSSAACQFRAMGNGHQSQGLLEVAPGNGWLAREADRILWLPQAVDMDTAHACIEPILTAHSFEQGVRLIQKWPSPNVAFSLLNTDSPIRVFAHGFSLEYLNGSVRLVHADLRQPPTAVAYATPAATNRICSSVAPEPVSGMLVEGVVRAGGWRWRPSTPCPNASMNGDDWELLSEAGCWPIGARLTIGRGVRPTSEFSEFVSLADNAVSRRHALLLGGTDGPRIIDSHSRNGTWVVSRSGDAAAIHDRGEVRLADGDVIVVGKTTFTVRQRSAGPLNS